MILCGIAECLFNSHPNMTFITILDFTEAQLYLLEIFVLRVLHNIFLQLDLLVQIIASHPRTFFLMSSLVCATYHLSHLLFQDEENEDEPDLIGHIHKISDRLHKIGDLVEEAKKKNVLINVVTFGEVTHYSAKSNRRYISDFGLSITYYSSIDNPEKNMENHKLFSAVQKYLTNQK